MIAVGYIVDAGAIIKASWSLFRHDCKAAFKLSEWSPLPPPLSAKDFPGGRTQILNVRQIQRINCHLVESDENSTPETISYTEDWLHWNGNLDNPNDSEDNCPVDTEYGIVQDNRIKDPNSPEQQDVSAPPNVPGLIWPTQRSKRQAEKVSMMVNAIETRRKKGVKKKYDTMRQCFTSFLMYLDREF